MDKKRKPYWQGILQRQTKITLEAELSIVALRNTFEWGTARIQQGLLCLPEYIKESLPFVVQGTNLSRQAINQVLKKHGITATRENTIHGSSSGQRNRMSYGR